jgi:hypothetical protein
MVGTRDNQSLLIHRAFITCSRMDRRIGKRVQKVLHEFRMPGPLRGRETTMGPVPERLIPIFRNVGYGGKEERRLQAWIARLVANWRKKSLAISTDIGMFGRQETNGR